jgi:molybdopterin molybdotransferase
MTENNDDRSKTGSSTDHDHQMHSVSEAAALALGLRERWFERLPTETVALDWIAGRTVAEPIDAPRDFPEYSHATMDGYAFDATVGYPYELADEVFPEDEPPSIESGEAVRIYTGAPLPPSTNAVLKQEEATVNEGQLDGTATDPGAYVYERGNNVASGERLFDTGERLGPEDALLLGDLGIERVSVRERLSVGLLATGTEIHEGRTRDLDSPMLAGLVRSWGHQATHEGTVPDDLDRVTDRIAALADDHDVVMTTGGTSVGDKDHVVRVLSSLGDVRFHRVSLRPGKPIAVAELDDAIAIAIPGKPVGAHAVTSLVARPFFTGQAELPTITATVTHDVGLPTAEFTYAIPVSVSDGEAVPLGHAASALSVYEETFDPSVLSSSTRATRADGIVVTESALSAGESVEIVPYPSLE